MPKEREPWETPKNPARELAETEQKLKEAEKSLQKINRDIDPIFQFIADADQWCRVNNAYEAPSVEIHESLKQLNLAGFKMCQQITGLKDAIEDLTEEADNLRIHLRRRTQLEM